MTDTYAGNYPIENRAGEVERLDVQSDAWAPDTEAMLDRFGDMTGWACLDVGCGPGGITANLSRRVGPTGRVLGLDMDDELLEHGRRRAAPNVEFMAGDAYDTGLPAASFDLVHMRFVASTAGDPDRLIAEASRLAKPGAIVALQEPDGASLYCYPPHPAWDALKMALLGVFKGVGADLELARSLYHVVHASGLLDVQYRAAILGVRSTDPMVDYLPATVESIRGTVLKLGLLSDAQLDTALADCRAHLRTAGTAFTMYTVAQVWGRPPS